MKGLILFFCVLLVTFFSSWGIKARYPVARPNGIEAEAVEPWYMTSYNSPQADVEWLLDPTIPDNYIPVIGEEELYMIVDSSGKIIGYKHRIRQADGSWLWEDVNPDIPNNYELVAGSKNLYKVIAEDGTVSYFLYIRNADNTYCFVPCDEFGMPYYDGADADVITSNFENYDGNIYVVHNENGVVEGYAERVKDEENGGYTWKALDKPVNREYAANTTTERKEISNSTLTESSLPGWNNTEATTNKIVIGSSGENDNITRYEDGTYSVTNRTMNTVSQDGYTIKYETVVINTYDKDGNLIFTKQEGPTEISRERTSSAEIPDQSLIKSSLDEEYQRVSNLVSYNTELANQVLALLNAERTAEGLGTLSMSYDSESYKLAAIRAGDMALYKFTSSESPMYGTLDNMVSRWGCNSANASENIWTAGNKSANDIHARLQAYEGSRGVRMSSYYTEVGICIVSVDGQLYIAEIYLK